MRGRFNRLVTKQAKQVTARIYDDEIPVALGVVLREDGVVLTKGSSLKSDSITCKLPNGETLPAKILSRDSDFDIALLQVHANALKAAEWAKESPEIGAWLAIPNGRGKVASVGCLSVKAREIPVVRAVIGVQLDIKSTKIVMVAEEGGAHDAGLLAGDFIRRVDKRNVKNIKEVHSILDDFRAGDTVSVVVNRSGGEIEKTILLGAPEDVFFNFGHWELSGPLTRRRDGFPSAIQLDAVLRPSLCGGPLIDVSGNIIGVTLARSDRIATLAATYQDLKPTLDRMLSTVKAVTNGPVADKK